MVRAQVLTTGSWPTQMAARCSLPRELEACCEEFRAFYLASHSGRKLSWQTNMGNAGAPAMNQAWAEPACGSDRCSHCRHCEALLWPAVASILLRSFVLLPAASMGLHGLSCQASNPAEGVVRTRCPTM